MIPNFELFGKTFSVYMITALVGFLVILYFTYRTAQKRGLDEMHMLYMILFSAIGVGVGAHLLYGITNLPHLVWLMRNLWNLPSWRTFWSYLMLIFGGSVFYGGLIGAILVSFAYLKRNHLDSGAYSDIAATAIPLFHTFGRIGCFLSGCCYGIPWAHGITYRYCAIESANFVARFPVQLVESGLNLGLFFLLHYFWNTNRFKSHLLHLYLLIYPAYRFLLEFLRGDEYRGFLFSLSTSQIISIGLIAISAATWAAEQKKAPRSDCAKPANKQL